MLYEYAGFQRALLRTIDDFGFLSYDLVGFPRRLCEVETAPALVESNIDKRRLKELPTPSRSIADKKKADDEGWLTQSSRALARVYASFLLAEDPQRRLDAQKAATLMHQVSLVQHILERPALRKVLIGDEVGLGKTIEAGLIIKQLLKRNRNLRVLYLAPARLVSNVAREFREKLDINARVWAAGAQSDARLEEDRVVIASIHKAVFGENFNKVVESGPWDLLIVDECHHLSDWNPFGGKPNQAFKLVSHLTKNQSSEGRLILMSGTPHQGSEARFRNILRLLSDDLKDISGSAGRVIFRTKDRVRDWRGDPLFPAREIRPPVVVQLGERYESWYQRIGLLYESTGLNGVQMRAAGWAKGQALQWAASSVQAGLGFLVRLGIRRLGWTLSEKSLALALEVLRPYRGGAIDEPLSSLFARICKQIGNYADADDLDEGHDEWDEETWRPDPVFLSRLLREGVELVQNRAADAKWNAVCDLIDQAGDEKIVLFAQPVETVTVVAEVLAKRYGVRPSQIIGNQSDEERTEQVARFQSASGPRFLVSSKAGGEGLNMQKARRLIHLDVPWNPMDLEQRIGRVHRFGSRKKILVDTVVAAGSREIDMYRIAREKLALAVRHLDPDKFEQLFSRVMSLVPPRELEAVLGNVGVPMAVDAHATDEIGRLVTEGFRSWSSFDNAYRSQADEIRATNPGQATWADLATFLVKYAGAHDGVGASFSSFKFSEDEIVEVEQSVPTIHLADEVFAVGDTGGLLASLQEGHSVTSLGMNLPQVQRLLRSAFAPERESLIAFVKQASDVKRKADQRPPTAHFVFLRQKLQQEGGRWVEAGLELKLFEFVEGASPQEQDPPARASLIRKWIDSTRVRNPETIQLPTGLEDAERSLFSILRQPSDSEIHAGVRYAVWPIALVVGVS